MWMLVSCWAASQSAALTSVPEQENRDETPQPESGINFVLYSSENLDIVKANTGVLLVDDKINTIQTLATDKMVMRQAGFLEIFVNNDAQTPVYYDNLRVAQTSGFVSEVNAYYPFGLLIGALSFQAAGDEYNAYKYSQKELQTEMSLNWGDHGARMADYTVGRWWVPDPLSENHYNVSSYAYVLNNPIIYIDPFGLDTVYVFDQATQPINNGTEAQTYTATIYVEQNGIISRSYSGSSYPNNNTRHNTVDEGEHTYNNQSGHRGGTQQGLNLVDANGERNSPGTDPSGNPVDPSMTVVNVHSGQPQNETTGTYNRGSEGCPTVSPNDAAAFMGNFDWSGASGNTGTSTGTIIILRGDNATRTRNRVESQRDWQQNRLTPLVPRPARISF